MDGHRVVVGVYGSAVVVFEGDLDIIKNYPVERKTVFVVN